MKTGYYTYTVQGGGRINRESDGHMAYFVFLVKINKYTKYFSPIKYNNIITGIVRQNTVLPRLQGHGHQVGGLITERVPKRRNYRN